MNRKCNEETDRRRLTLSEAAVRLGVSVETLSQWIAQGYLDAYPTSSREASSGVPTHTLLTYTDAMCIEQPLWLDAEQVEELAERLAWSQLGHKSWTHDEE